MNVTELARRLKVPTQELMTKLPLFGFHIGMRAVKVDDRIAKKIIENWSRLNREHEAQKSRDAKSEQKSGPVQDEHGNIQVLRIPDAISVRDFSALVQKPITHIMGILMKNGILANLNERIDFGTALIIAEDLGYKVEQEAVHEAGSALIEESAMESLTTKANPVPRPPVVVVMGHVDHGKTTLLDTIRSASVATGEAGGITQHIGAYQATFHLARDKKGVDRTITVIDTPGHEAFSTMRSRGARVADIAILVVAADDGVQPQTKEALDIIKAAKIPYVVAVNKIDKEGADPDKIKRQLADIGVLPEDWGGKVPFVSISAKKNLHIDTLLDVISLLAEIAVDDITADPTQHGAGTVIDSNKDPGEGIVATLIVQNGTIRTGDALAIKNAYYGKVRSMRNFKGEIITEAPPSTPIRILGLKTAPGIGEIIVVSDNPDALEKPRAEKPQERASAIVRAQTDASTSQKSAVLPVIVKADVLGSLEAIVTSLEGIDHPEVGVKVIGKGLGNVTETDVLRAETAGGIVFAFHVKPSFDVAQLALEKGVKISRHDIIYDLLKEAKHELQALLQPEIVIESVGSLKVLGLFHKKGKSSIVGGRVSSGKAVAKTDFVIMRDGKEVGEGKIEEVRSGPSVIKEGREGQEVGMRVMTKSDILEGDELVMSLKKVIEKTLE